MNKLSKALIAALGGVNTVFELVIPISIAIMIISTVNIGPVNNMILLIVAFLATVYRAVKMCILD